MEQILAILGQDKTKNDITLNNLKEATRHNLLFNTERKHSFSSIYLSKAKKEKQLEPEPAPDCYNSRRKEIQEYKELNSNSKNMSKLRNKVLNKFQTMRPINYKLWFYIWDREITNLVSFSAFVCQQIPEFGSLRWASRDLDRNLTIFHHSRPSQTARTRLQLLSTDGGV